MFVYSYLINAYYDHHRFLISLSLSLSLLLLLL